jgi:hypothetical protein
MATETVPTTITPEAAALAREYGVERELEAILEKGKRMVKGLQALHVDVSPANPMWPEDEIRILAEVDPAVGDDPSHTAWWSWRLDQYPLAVAERFLVLIREARNGR